MDHPTPPRELSEDALLIQIERLARAFAAAILDAERANDVAHDVVLDVLVKLRAKKVTLHARSLRGLVRRMVRQRAVDDLRRRRRRGMREAEHAREVSESAHAWMSPELAYEERELAAFHEHALASLPYNCRQSYMMVREGQASYKVTAERLGIAPSAVHWHVASAQRRFRRELEERGISAPRGCNGYTGTRSGTSARARALQGPLGGNASRGAPA